MLGALDLKVCGGGDRRVSSRTLTGDRGGGSVSTIWTMTEGIEINGGGDRRLKRRGRPVPLAE